MGIIPFVIEYNRLVSPLLGSPVINEVTGATDYRVFRLSVLSKKIKKLSGKSPTAFLINQMLILNDRAHALHEFQNLASEYPLLETWRRNRLHSNRLFLQLLWYLKN